MVRVYLSFLLTVLSSFAFAENFHVFLDDIAVNYDEDTQYVTVVSLLNTRGEMSNGSSISMGNGFSEYSMTCDGTGFNFNHKSYTFAKLRAQAHSQNEYRAQTKKETNIAKLAERIRSKKEQGQKILELLAHLSKGDLLSFEDIKTLSSTIDHKVYAIELMLDYYPLEDSKQAQILINHLANILTSDSSKVSTISTLTAQNDKLTFADIQTIYHSISSDFYKVEALKAVEMKGCDVLSIIKGIRADSYKVIAATLLPIEEKDFVSVVKSISSDYHKSSVIGHFKGITMSKSTALSLLYAINSQNYRADVIVGLASFLEELTNSERSTLLNSFSSFYRRQVERYLPTSKDSLNEGETDHQTEYDTKNDLSINISGILRDLASSSWDDDRVEALSCYELKYLTPRQLSSILRTFTWDDGRTRALTLLYRTLSAESKIAMKGEVSMLLNTYTWGDGKNLARKIILHD